MAIAWVQGASTYIFGGDGQPMITITPSAGDCLVLSVGVAVTGNPIFFGLTVTSVTDTRGNIWTLVCQSPPQTEDSDNFASGQIWTFIATNVAGGATTITIATNGAWNAVTVDEYSGVASIRAVDARSFNSTPYFSGLSSVDSLSIPINGTEMVYSVAFADTQYEVFTPTSGFNARETVTGLSATLSSFDKLFTGGTADNVVTASLLPGSLHVVILALSATPVASTVLQLGYGLNFSPAPISTVTAAYPWPNTAGNLLIVVARVYERGDYSLADTQDNAWVTLPFPDNSPADLVVGYCLSAAAGANTVTLTGASGGSDVSLSLLVIEYNFQGLTFISSSWGQAQPGASVNTGNVPATSGDLLISALWLGLTGTGPYDGNGEGVPPVVSAPETWRYQYSDTGLYNASGAALVLADQTANSPGEYSNTFTPSVGIDNLVAAILGFSFTGGGGGGMPSGVGNMSPCGQLPSPELTVDINADWGDEDTFFITQDTPYPFTLRGIVLRMSVNQD